MALFNLTDISYQKEEKRNFSPGNILPNEYTKNLLRYPIDVGNTDRAHYIVIHINVQEKTSYPANLASDPRATIHKNRETLRNSTGALNVGGYAGLAVNNVKKITESISSTLKQNKTAQQFAGDLTKLAETAEESIRKYDPEGYSGDLKKVVAGAASGAEEALGKLDNETFLRKIKRTTDSIALYMPNTMAYTHNQQYNTLQMGGENASFYGAGLSMMNDAIAGKINAEQLGKNLTPFIAQKITQGLSPLIGQNSAAGIFASAFGGVQNPQLELIYTSPSFRSFRFDFMFYPTSEEEAFQVQQIVQRLKFHQAPEVMSGTAGYFLVPPSEFDIEFYYNGEINPNIPKISTCVLTTIDMDYAPKGQWQSYEVEGRNFPYMGGTGMPFAMRLSLGFQETEIMTKQNFEYQQKQELRSEEQLAYTKSLSNWGG